MIKNGARKMFHNGKWENMCPTALVYCFHIIRKRRVYDRVSLRRSYFVDEDQSPFNAEIRKNKQGKNKIPKSKTCHDGLYS